MVLPRRLHQRRRQLLIAVPSAFARQLGAGDGALLYWHRHRTGELVLSRLPVRKGGPPAAREDAGRILELERQVTKLQAQLAHQRESIWNEYRQQELGRQLHLELKGYPAIDAINERLRRIEGQLAERVVLPRARPTSSPESSPGRGGDRQLDGPQLAGAGARSTRIPSPEPSPSSS